MKKIKKSILINAPVEKVFSYIADRENEIEWMPSMLEVFNYTGSDKGDIFQWKYKMAGLLFEGKTKITEVLPNEKLRSVSKGGINCDFLFIFQPKNEGTLLELNIEYRVPMPVLGVLAEKAVLKRNERETDLALNNIKDKMENQE